MRTLTARIILPAETTTPQRIFGWGFILIVEKEGLGLKEVRKSSVVLVVYMPPAQSKLARGPPL